MIDHADPDMEPLRILICTRIGPRMQRHIDIIKGLSDADRATSCTWLKAWHDANDAFRLMRIFHLIEWVIEPRQRS